uniref:E-beta-farnesene synthase n=1 Tax=Tanacetum cinerariifolium TaxID=118510 RepID=A0A6L2P223_TANCI|nr:hypothetical protein [Tanacetum cinerariifolium]
MRNKESASWDLWHKHMGCWGEGLGTVSVGWSALEKSVGVKGFWREIWLGVVRAGVRFGERAEMVPVRKHKFHPRPDSPLHLPNEEHVLRYLKFSAKGTKKEVFGMPILGNLITTNIQGESYYQEYLVKVAKHQRYLAGETGSDPDSPAPKPTKTTKKSKTSVPKAALRPPITKPASSHKLIPNLYQPSLKERSRALEEILKSIYDVPWGPLLPVVIREPEFEKYQSLPEKSPADQCSFKRCNSTPTGSSGYVKSLSLYAELGLIDSEVESDEDVLGIDAGVQGEGQARPNPNDQDEGQAGPNPDEQAEGQAGSNPSDAEASQPLPSLVIHAGSDLEHMDLDVADVLTQPRPEQVDEGFTATAYPKVQENLKLTIEEHVILEEPVSSLGTLSYLQHLIKDLSFGDLFFNDKPSKADNKKTTAETEAESMVSVTIQQDTSSIPPMTTPRIGKLEHIMANLIQDNKHLEESLDSHGARLYTLENLDIPLQVSKAIDEVVTDAVDWAIQAPLWNRIRDLPEADMKEILHQRMWETNSYKTHEDHMMLYEGLEKSMNRDLSEELLKDLAEAHKEKKKRRLSGASGSPRASGSLEVPPPPPPPPSTNQEGQSQGSAARSSSKTATSVKYQAWTTTDTRLRPNAHIPKVNLRQDVPVLKNNWASALASTYSPPLEDSLLAQTGDKAIAMVPDQMWIEEECKYDIAAILEVFSVYGYDYMKKIVLRRADLNEHIIMERDFKYLYPSNFEDLYLLNLQETAKDKEDLPYMESFVGGRVKDEDYRLLKRTE